MSHRDAATVQRREQVEARTQGSLVKCSRMQLIHGSVCENLVTDAPVIRFGVGGRGDSAVTVSVSATLPS